MPIQVTCENCRSSYRVKDQYAGMSGLCRHCGGSITVPVAEAATVGATPVHQMAPPTGAAASLSLATTVPKKPCPSCGKMTLVGSASCFYCGADLQDNFDPYHKWLGIPSTQQPPNHYRLLGIPLYESDRDVIESAADQRMSHIRTFQTGRYSAQSQKVLNELAAAKVCLLNPQKKVNYDQALEMHISRKRALRDTPSIRSRKTSPLPPPVGSASPPSTPTLPSPVPRGPPAGASSVALPTVPSAPYRPEPVAQAKRSSNYEDSAVASYHRRRRRSSGGAQMVVAFVIAALLLAGALFVLTNL